MTKRKVCVVITARPSYSRIKTTLQAIKEHPELELQIVLAGPACLTSMVMLIDILHDDGFEVAERVIHCFGWRKPDLNGENCRYWTG